MSRNIANLCRDEEEDVHSLYRQLREDTADFYRNVRERRAALGIKQNEADPGHQRTADEHRRVALNAVLCSSDRAVLDAASARPLGTANGADPRPSSSATGDARRLSADVYAAAEGGPLAGDKVMQLYQIFIGPDMLLKHLQRYSPESVGTYTSTFEPHHKTYRDTMAKFNEKDMMDLIQAMERRVLELRKFYSCLGIPGVAWRRSGALCVASDLVAGMLGYTREDLLDGLSIFDILAPEEALPLTMNTLLPLLVTRQRDTVAFSATLLCRDGSCVRTRASYRLIYGPHNLPIIFSMMFVPLDLAAPRLHNPVMQVVPARVHPIPARGAEDLLLGPPVSLLSALDPTTSFTKEELASILMYF